MLIKKYWPFLVLGLIALLSHGLLLLNDGIYWDEWLLGSYLAENNWYEVNQWATESGMPAIGYFYWGLRLIGLFPAYKIIAFFVLFATAVLVYKLCRQSNSFTRIEAVTVAALSLVYPAYQTAVELSTFRYLVFYCLFMYVVLQLWQTVQTEQPPKITFWRRVFLLALLYFSFNLNSLLVYYFPFLIALFWQIKIRDSLTWHDVAKTQLLSKADFIALPFVHFAVKTIFFRAHGAYAGYNELNLDPASVFMHLGNYSKNALYGQIDASLSSLSAHPMLLIFLLPLTYLAYTRYQVLGFEQPEGSTTIVTVSTYGSLLFALGLLLSAMFPYAAVGLSPSMSGWSTRHALLASLPVALIIVLSLRLLWAECSESQQGVLDGRFIASLIGAVLIVAFTSSTISYYISWQARAVKDKAIMADLAEVPVMKNFSVFWVNDQYPLGGERLYRFYEWAGMLKKTWGDESHIGFQLQGYSQQALMSYRNLYNKSNNLSQLNPAGCQALLNIKPGPIPYSEQQLVWQYYLYKYTKPEKLNDFLHGVLTINIEVPEVEDPRCPTGFPPAKPK